MRLIDADALYESLMTIETGKEYNFCYPCMEVLQVIKKQPTVTQPEPEWIPVSERLPKENSFYLTSTMFGEVYLNKWNGINWERTEEVLAWMPLPNPYKEGEQDD